MSLRLGRFGKQESACVCGLGAMASGMLAVDTEAVYAQGNVCWLATLLGLLGAVLIFLWVTNAMERQGKDSLWGMLEAVTGRALGRILGIILMLMLIAAAVLPNLQLLSAMNRYVFEGADAPEIALYQMGAVLLLVWLGMEAIARTGRLLALPAIVSVGLAIFLASPAFGWYHLFPLLGAGLGELLRQSVQTLFRFLPSVAALCLVGEGCQGVKCLRESGLAGLFGGGMLAVLMQLALGLSCYSWDISTMPVPLYHMTMATRYDAVTVRLDVTVLFLWVLCALGAGAFYLYAGSLLFCKVARLEDIRPVGAGISALSVGLGLMLYEGEGVTALLSSWLYAWGWVLGVLPLGVVLLLCIGRRGKASNAQGVQV